MERSGGTLDSGSASYVIADSALTAKPSAEASEAPKAPEIRLRVRTTRYEPAPESLCFSG